MPAQRVLTNVDNQGTVTELAERQQLQTLLRAIIPYLPQPVVEEQLADPDVGRVKGEYWEGSVLFADLSGFTALSETLSALGKQGAEEITRIVNDLFGALLEDVERYGGVLVKFGGDAMTVYFGGHEHALRAARAGLALQETMGRRFVNLETAGGVFTLQLRVGVHTGKIFAAQVGYEPGYRLRGMELVVTGTDINRVAEAQDCAAPGQVCITAETLAPIVNQAEAEPMAGGMYRLEGLSRLRPIEVTPEGGEGMLPDGAPLPLLRLYLQALGPYLPVDFTDERNTDPSDPELRPDLRPVAVLFANFADLSAILSALKGKGKSGERAATNILNMYYARMQDVIGRYGGVINKVDMYTHGDKLMALFGAPRAYGDDAERAVRAALEMQAVMPEVNRFVQTVLGGSGLPFRALTQRIGVNYGHVFAGRVGSEREGSRREYTVMGDAVNLAARLMTAADEGDILISPSVRRQVADRFKLEDLSPIRVKGKAQPIPISRPLRPLTESERAAFRRGRGQRPFIGRAAQLEVMQAAAQQTIGGQGQMVVVVGEAGTGKTRLVEAFQDYLLALPSSSSLSCYSTEMPSYAQEPYAPFIVLLRGLIGLVGQTVEDVNRLNEWVDARAPDLFHFLPLLGDLLALPIADNPVTDALTLEQRHDRLFDLIEAVLHGEARRRPLALVVDDLQWADESSLALLERLTRGVVTDPLLLVLCYRPDVPFSTPWTELPHSHAVQVAEFSPEESSRLVVELLEAEELPEGLAEMVWARAQGHPFFTEEFVKSLRETRTIIEVNGRWELVDDEAAMTSIPDTIEGLVLARLDGLEARCRDVLQAASVAAMSQARFALLLLERVDPYPGELPERLHSLVGDGLLEALESELEALEYHFRHTLTRDVAYDSLLYARRRELHLLIAQAIDALYADRLDEYLTSLAHHYREAEEWPRAFHYQRRAGERAQALFANKDAGAHFRDALTIVEEHLPDVLAAVDSAELVRALVDIHERLGDVLLLEGRYDEALEAYESARALLTDEGPPALTSALCRKTVEVYRRKADYDLAHEWLRRALGVLADLEVVETARVYNLGGGVFYRQGQYDKALEWRQRALQIAERLGDQREIANAYLVIGPIYLRRGEMDKAIEYGRRSLKLFQALNDLAGMTSARLNLGIIYTWAEEWTQAAEHFREGLRLNEMMGDVMQVGLFANALGNVLLNQGQLDEAERAYNRSVEVWQPSGYRAGVAAARINLAKVAIRQDKLEVGATHLTESLALVEEIGAQEYLPEIFSWRAVLHLAQDENDAALTTAERACQLAQESGDRIEEGRALRVLGQAYAAMGQPEKAVEQLEASLACYVELKSTCQAAKTHLQLALVYLEQLGKKEEGQRLLEQARAIFAELGAQWDLAQAERAIEEFQV
jgi:class 3 adenylate cyclase/predicted ATPase